MTAERARQRYQLKIELLDDEDASIAVLLATVPLVALRSGPLFLPKRTRADLGSVSPPILDPSGGDGDAPAISEAPLKGVNALRAQIGPDERIVTIIDRSSGDTVLKFLVPAGEEANDVVTRLHHDYLRQSADVWRTTWIEAIPETLVEPS